MNLIGPDEHGMAYLDLGVESKSVKQKQGQVVYDLNDKGQVVGVEFLFAPNAWLIKDGPLDCYCVGTWVCPNHALIKGEKNG